MWAYRHGTIPSISVDPPYIHHAVNHLRNFVCPLTEAHTNHVESFWSKMKSKAMSEIFFGTHILYYCP